MSKKNKRHVGYKDNGYPLPDRTVHYSRKKNLQPVPEVGKKYHCFDDGKIRFSRHYIIEVTEVLNYMAFKKKYPDWYGRYIETAKDHYWLYSRSTDWFVICEHGENNEFGVFVRTKDGGWFGLGIWWNSGELDATGELWNYLVEHADDFSWESEEEKLRTIQAGTI